MGSENGDLGRTHRKAGNKGFKPVYSRNSGTIDRNFTLHRTCPALFGVVRLKTASAWRMLAHSRCRFVASLLIPATRGSARRSLLLLVRATGISLCIALARRYSVSFVLKRQVLRECLRILDAGSSGAHRYQNGEAPQGRLSVLVRATGIEPASSRTGS